MTDMMPFPLGLMHRYTTMQPSLPILKRYAVFMTSARNVTHTLLNKVVDSTNNCFSRRPDSPLAQYVDVVKTQLNVDSSDINLIEHLRAANDDTDDCESASSTSDDNSIEPCDVLRHFWTRNGDLKYWVMHNGIKLYKTAEELEMAYGGVKYALWTYWHNKKARNISLNKVINHLKHKGHEGFYREMLWHLLPQRIQRILSKLRKDGKLDKFFF